eukprot:SAG22_NODE_72_length_22344_cov_95.586559_2_plen_47_part_00
MLPLAAVLGASSFAAPPAPHIVHIMADDTGVRTFEPLSLVSRLVRS